MPRSRIKARDLIISTIPVAVAVWAIAGREWDLALAGIATSVLLLGLSLARSDLPLAKLVRQRGGLLIVSASLASVLIVVVPFLMSGTPVVWKVAIVLAFLFIQAVLFVIWYRSRDGGFERGYSQGEQN